NHPLPESIDLDFLLAYAVGSLLVFGWGMTAWRMIRKGGTAESSMAGLGMSSANTGFIGVSICAMVLGTEPASRGVAMTILVESTLVIPLAVAIADAGATQGEVKFFRRMAITLKGLVRSPLLIAIVIGLLLSALQIPLK